MVRYAEDNPTGEATTPPYPFAWRYRDWVIEAVNQDVPYDRFVKLQLAADEMPGTPRQDMVGAGVPRRRRRSITRTAGSRRTSSTTLYTDDWDERIDTVTRGLLGMTVACARCHDHKFDPIPTRDYYAFQGVFASIVAGRRVRWRRSSRRSKRGSWLAEQRLFYLSYVANLLRGDPGSKPTEAREKVERFVAEMERIKEEMSFLKDEHPEMYAQLDAAGPAAAAYPRRSRRPAAAQVASTQPAGARAERGGSVAGGGDWRRRRAAGAGDRPSRSSRPCLTPGRSSTGPTPDFTMIDVRPGEPRDMHVLPGGNVARAGRRLPRGGSCRCCRRATRRFTTGRAGANWRERIFTDGAPLAARVIVNRVWGWHFGKPLVATPSDFGVQGEKPTHPRIAG